MFRFLIINDFEEQDAARNHMRIERTRLRDAQNPFEIPDVSFICFYRLPKHLVEDLITKIEPTMRIAQRCTSIPHNLQVLAFLSVVANGNCV